MKDKETEFEYSLPFVLTITCLLALLLTACTAEPAPTPTPPPAPTVPAITYNGTILAFGDSLTEGLGVAEGEAYPALLQKKLQADGYHYQVINAGISGETSSGAVSRLDWVSTLEVDIVIVEMGGNDSLRGIDTDLTEQNLSKIIETFQAQDKVVVLAGMQTLQNMGQEYTTAFAEIYPTLAQKYQLIFIPFFLEGVAADPNLNQPDGIHPTAEGYEIILETIYPYVLQALNK